MRGCAFYGGYTGSMSNTQPLSPGEMALGRRAMYDDAWRGQVDRVLAVHGGLISAAARAMKCSVEEMADRALMSGALDVGDPRVLVMTSPVARKACGLHVGLADGAERRLVERCVDPSEAARQAAGLLAEAELRASEAHRTALRGARLALLSLAEIGGHRASTGLGLAAPVLEQAGLLMAKDMPERAAEAFGLACAFVESERAARTQTRANARGNGDRG